MPLLLGVVTKIFVTDDHDITGDITDQDMLVSMDATNQWIGAIRL